MLNSSLNKPAGQLRSKSSSHLSVESSTQNPIATSLVVSWIYNCTNFLVPQIYQNIASAKRTHSMANLTPELLKISGKPLLLRAPSIEATINVKENKDILYNLEHKPPS